LGFPTRARLQFGCKFFRHFDQRATQFRVDDVGKCAQQAQCIRLCQHGDWRSLERLFVECIGTVKKGAHGDAENARNLEEAATADTIDAVLVLLDLLKSDPNMFSKLRLRQPSIKTMDTNIAPHKNINWITASASHLYHSATP